MPDWFITQAEPSDHFALAQLVNSAYRGESARLGWTHESDFFDGPRTNGAMIAQSLAGPDPALILCLRQDPAGPIRACISLKREGSACYLGMLTVAPDGQGKGLGRILLDEAERYARLWQADRLRMQVLFMRAELIAWYERRGYRRTSETVPFPQAEAARDKPLRDDLHFVVLEKMLLPQT